MTRVSRRRRADAQSTAVTPPDSPANWATHAALACLCIWLAGLAALDPDRFREAMQEDALAEWATFWLFAAAGAGALLMSGRLVRPAEAPRNTRSTTVVLFGLGLFCLFVAGEEISWGQRFFGFRPPAFFLESNYQQELNLHNLFMAFVRTRLLVAAVALAYGVLLPLLAHLGSGAGNWLWRWIRAAAPSQGLWPWFLLVAIAELSYPVSFAGEATELVLGAVFLVDVWCRAARIVPIASVASPAAVLAAALAVLVLSRMTIVVGGTVALAGDEALVDLAESDLDRLGDDLALGDAIRPSLVVSGNVHLRVFTAVQKHYLRFSPEGAFLGPGAAAGHPPTSAWQDRQAAFLDPWHNSYWVYSNRNGGVILLYSMGPNRKRDTMVTSLTPAALRAADMQGDDLGVAVVLVPGR